MADSEIIALFKKYDSGRMDTSEMKLFADWYKNCEMNDFERIFEQALPEKRRLLLKPLTSGRRKEIEIALDEAERKETQSDFSSAVSGVPRIGLNRKWWWAAAIFLFLGTGAYFFLHTNHRHTIQDSRYMAMDIGPGKQGAVLTLSDGSKVVLDSLDNGVIATQGGAEIKLKNGKLLYPQPVSPHSGEERKETNEEVQAVTAYNTMATPKGRQFTVVLPDGTQVWLNSASSITYPTVFTGNRRGVRITGEAYFEVAKDKYKPFHVNVNDMDVEVLGTHFNINSYEDESSINTTLLEGSVKISKGADVQMLIPGQLAQVSRKKEGKITLIRNADTEKIMAWKNGLFNFDGMRLDAAMRQLSRWYDIEIVYEKGVPDIEFIGEMSKNVSLSGLLNSLQGVGVHFRIEGRRLIVLP